MKNQRKAWLAAGLLALVAAACFSDPTSDLRSGPVAIQTTVTSVSVKAGDSVDVRGVVKDAQGNPLPVGAVTWVSADPTVAVANLDTIALAPGDIFTRAFIRGVTNQAGVTTVTVTAQGISADVRVTVLPATFPGTAAVTGTVGPDTISVNRPAPQPPLVIPYTAGDTLVLTATATVTFSPTTSTVAFGPFPGYIVSRSATQIKAMSRQAYAGKVTITNLSYSGDATTGSIAIPTIQTDSITLQHARFTGAVVVATSAFGANTQMTLTAPAGMTFNTAAPATTVTLGAANGTILSRTASTITLISTGNYTGSVLVNNVTIGAAAVDSLRTGTAPLTIAASFFPGTVTQAGTGQLLDLITINSGASATFTATGANASVVTLGSVNGVLEQAFIVSRSATVITAIAKVGNNSPIAISNVIIAGTTIPSLATSTPVVVTTATTGEANELTNNTNAGATPLAFTGAADTITVYGSIDCEDDGTACPGNGDISDRYLLTLGAPANLRMIVEWFGDGTAGNNTAAGYGSQPQNPDLDIRISTAAAALIVSSAGIVMPETASTAAPQPAANYLLRVDGWVMTGPITYKMRVLRF